MRVLVAEDNESDLIIERAMLVKLGLTDIHEARGGKEALRKIITAAATGTPYDLVITDWNMPTMSGLELMLEIQKQKQTSKTPVIFLTSVSDDEQVQQAIAKGVTDFILKPVTIETLKSKIEKVLNLV